MDYNARYKKACSHYDLWRGLLSDVYNYVIPERNGWENKTEGQEENIPIHDDTAVLSAPRYASRMQWSLMPEWRNWANFVSGTDVPEDQKKVVDSQLQEFTNEFFDYLSRSNFYVQIQPSLIDSAISTGAILGEEAPFTDDALIHWRSIPLHELKIEGGQNGVIENAWWCQRIMGEIIMEKWGDTIPAELKEKIDKKPVELYDIVLGQVKKSDGYHIVLMWDKEVFQETVHEKARLICFGISAMPSETYRRGPALQVFPTIRRLNKVQELYLTAAEYDIGGIWYGMDDGVFNPYTFTPLPAVINPVMSNPNGGPPFGRVDAGTNVQLSSLIIEDMQDTIRKAFFVDPMGDINDPVRTLGEQQLRMQEFMKDQGAAVSRLYYELVDRIIDLQYDIMLQRGIAPKLKINSKEIDVRYVSPLSRQDEMDQFQNTRMFLDSVSGLPPEVVGAKVKIEDIPQLLIDDLGLPKTLKRSEEELKQMAADESEVPDEQA